MDTKDLDALVAAMNRSAERLQTLWFTFMAVTLYLAISAFTTTHRVLLLEEGQTLPILNVKLPLLPFYVIAPAFYVIFHAYLLMMLVLLARTAKTFEEALRASDGMIDSDRERYRMRLENTIFLQIIVGAVRERRGANGLLLRAIALTTLALAPVLLLLLFQLMFLPYHSEIITWWHRILVVVDLALVWTLWPSYRYEWGNRMMPRLRPASHSAVRIALSAAVVVFSLLVATFPTESIHGTVLATRLDLGMFGSLDDMEKRGVFPNRLWLPNEDFVDDDKLKRIVIESTLGDTTRPAYSIDLSQRNLAYANLRNVDLRLASFEGANLTGANLEGAWLTEAFFLMATMRDARLFSASLQGAMLARANLFGGDLLGADMNGALLVKADLRAADLTFAQLRGADLAAANLMLARLTRADLRGASLRQANLQGASFDSARLGGTSLALAYVWRTQRMPDDLELVDLQGLHYDFACDDADAAGCVGQIMNQLPARKRARIADLAQALNPEVRPRQQTFTKDAGDAALGKQGLQSMKAYDDMLERIACSPVGSPYVARGMIASFMVVGEARLEPLHRRLVSATNSSVGAEECPGAKGLTAADLARLDSSTPRPNYSRGVRQ